MNKEDIVKALREIADLMEITDASPFEFQAFRNGAQGLDEWEGDLTESASQDNLTEIPSVGKAIAKVIQELVSSGSSSELDRVRGLVPDELPKLLRFRGLGPKRVRALWEGLEIESPGDLENAIHEGRVKELKGFGAKTIEKMLESIEYFRNAPKVKSAPSLSSVPKAIESTGTLFGGTSGYSYPKWKGRFYPAKAKTDDLLLHYAKQLPSVEINNTFYRFPSEKVVEQWRSQTPDSFQFALKAHRRVTHQMRLSPATAVRIQEFVDRCSVLGSRLGCILFQLPPDFQRDDDRLSTLLDALPDGPRYAVEFRHESWHVPEVHDRLRAKNVATVSGDSEDQSPQHYVTADFVYVRLRKPAYESLELTEWDEWFSKQRSQNRDVLVYLKHDETGDAPLAIQEQWYHEG